MRWAVVVTRPLGRPDVPEPARAALHLHVTADTLPGAITATEQALLPLVRDPLVWHVASVTEAPA